MLKGKLSDVMKMAMPFVEKASESVKGGVDSFTHKALFDAIMASCAYTICEGGQEATEDEQYKLLLFVKTHDNLKSFGEDKVKERFNSYVERYNVDKEIGKAAVLEALGKLKNKDVDGKLVIRVAISICTAATKINDSQKQALTTLCNEMGLDVQQFNTDVEVSAPKRPPREEAAEEESSEIEGANIEGGETSPEEDSSPSKESKSE